MENKIFLWGILILTLFAVGAAVFLLQGEDGEEAILPEEEPHETPAAVEIVDQGLDEPPVEPAERVMIAPAETIPDALRAMPESFRKALGGFKGRVIEEDGAPVPEMKVEVLGAGFQDVIQDVESFLNQDDLSLTVKAAETVTKEDGTFFLPGVFPLSFYVLGIDWGGARPFIRVLDSLPGPSETVDLGDIVLPACTVLTGTVVDDRDKPVAGARVRAVNLPPIVFLTGLQDYRDRGSFLIQESSRQAVIDPPPIFHQLCKRLPLPTTSTGGDGTFRLEGVPKGLTNVVVDCADHVTAKQGPLSTAGGGEQDLGEILLDRGFTMKGKVLDSKGNPVAGVEVRMGNRGTFKEFVVLQAPVFTDEKGAFSLAGFSTMPVQIAFRRYPEDPWIVEGPFNAAGDSPILTLSMAYDLKVTVVHQDESPAKGARIKLRNRGGIKDLLFVQPHREPGARMERAGDGVFLVKDLAPGSYDVVATAPDCAVQRKKVRIDTRTVEETFILQPARTARVRVLSAEDETPVEWAEVYTCGEESDFVFRPDRISRARTDPSGLAVLKRLEARSYKVTVSHPAYAVTVDTLEVSVEKEKDKEEEKVILLRAGGNLEGVVLSGQTGNQGPYMLIMEPRGMRYSPEAQTPRMAVTDLENGFKVKNLTPGKWRIEVLPRIFHKEVSSLFELDGMRTLDRADVEIVAGETAYLEIVLGKKEQGPKAPLSGRVAVNGMPVAGVALTCRIRRTQQATTDAAGNYDFGQVPVGNGTLNISKLPGTGTLSYLQIGRRIEVTENMPMYEDFTLYTGSITGRIVPESGALAPNVTRTVGASLTEEDAPYTVWTNTRASSDGTFAFEGIPIGTYALESNTSDILFKPVTGIKVTPGGKTGPVVITELTPVTVKGKVILPGGTEALEYISYLMLLCYPKDEDSGVPAYIHVNSETGTFETTRLTPGSYHANLYGTRDMQFEPIPFEVPPGGITGLILTAVEKK